MKMNKKIKNLTVAMVIATTPLTLVGCSNEVAVSNVTMEDLIDDDKELLYLDDEIKEINSTILSTSKVDIIGSLNQTEKYLEIIKKIEDLDIDEYLEEDLKLELVNEEAQLLSIDEINEALDKFYEYKEDGTISKNNVLVNKNGEDALKTINNLYLSKRAVGNYLLDDGYSSLIEFGLLLTKGVALDASGMDVENYSNFTVPENKFSNIDYGENSPRTINYENDDTNEEFKITVNANNSLYEAINNLYRAQRSFDAVNDESVFNQDEVKLFEEVIDSYKNALIADYELDNYSLKEESSVSEKKDRVKVYTK